MSLINNKEQSIAPTGANQRNSVSIPSTNKNSGIFQTHNNNTAKNKTIAAGPPPANSRTLDNSSTIFGQHHHTAGNISNGGIVSIPLINL